MSDDSASGTPEPGSATPPIGNLPGGRFYTVAEVAATIRLSKMSVYRMIHNGELEAVHFGRSIRVTEKGLDAYLKRAFFEAG